MIKAVIFDCFGVLTTDSWKELVGTLPQEQHPVAASLNRAYDAGQLTEDEFVAEVKRQTNATASQLAKVLFEGEQDKNTQLLNYIADLRPRYKTAILSNVASNWIQAEFLTEKEQKLFDAFIFSYQVGAVKPDTKMFDAVLGELQIKPEESVFIDDVARYIAAAKDLGMQGIVYKNFDQMKNELDEILAADAEG